MNFELLSREQTYLTIEALALTGNSNSDKQWVFERRAIWLPGIEYFCDEFSEGKITNISDSMVLFNLLILTRHSPLSSALCENC